MKSYMRTITSAMTNCSLVMRPKYYNVSWVRIKIQCLFPSPDFNWLRHVFTSPWLFPQLISTAFVVLILVSDIFAGSLRQEMSVCTRIDSISASWILMSFYWKPLIKLTLLHGFQEASLGWRTNFFFLFLGIFYLFFHLYVFVYFFLPAVSASVFYFVCVSFHPMQSSKATNTHLEGYLVWENARKI